MQKSYYSGGTNKMKRKILAILIAAITLMSNWCFGKGEVLEIVPNSKISANANFRKGADASSEKIEVLKTGTEVFTLCEEKNRTWVWNDGKLGTIYTTCLTTHQDTGLAALTTADLNMRKEFDDKSEILATIPAHTRVEQYDITNNGRVLIRYKNTFGTILADKTELMGEALAEVTTEAKSNGNRDFNISLACSKIDGLILKPGEEFSWWKEVGQCGKAQGFKTATIFVNKKSQKGYGGGVCQVATTLNIAAKEIGIKTNARPHSKRVAYAKKEDEATVAYGSVNFSFKNTLDHSIQIFMYSSEGKCTCEIYKTSE